MSCHQPLAEHPRIPPCQSISQTPSLPHGRHRERSFGCKPQILAFIKFQLRHKAINLNQLLDVVFVGKHLNGENVVVVELNKIGVEEVEKVTEDWFALGLLHQWHHLKR